jgi:uncharacterized protein YbjT (DUF2867 family)
MRIAVAGGTGVVGSYVVQAARSSGHDVVVLARSSGFNLRSDDGKLVAALEGVEVIIDTTNPSTVNRTKATSFFTEVTSHLQRAGSEVGTAHIVALSILGVDRIPGYGYFQAKLAHERAVAAGPIPATIVRAAQFYEFPAEILARTRCGPFALIPIMRVQPIAARSVGELLVETAIAPAARKIIEVAGTGPENLVAMARSIVLRRARRVLILPLAVPGSAGKAMRDESLLPSPGTRALGPSFTEWLATSDALSPRF